ncbi:hypothetical protein V7968_20500 [Nocardia vulneris]|uniref:hypothetical protein n=1 Tax=Nocardia vulneris TaxID=1141657 RepID=UPI0030D14404
MTNGREIVATGLWLYGGDTVMPVFVVRMDYDFWYEMGREEGTLEEDEEPLLDSAGHAYYVSFKALRDGASFWPDSGPHRSVEEAQNAAESRVPSPVVWQATELSPLPEEPGHPH